MELKYERTCLCPNVRSKFQLYKNFGEISVIKRPKMLKAKPRSLYTRIHSVKKRRRILLAHNTATAGSASATARTASPERKSSVKCINMNNWWWTIPFNLTKCQTANWLVQNLQTTATLHLHLIHNLDVATVRINLRIGTGLGFCMKTCLNYASKPWVSTLKLHQHLIEQVS